jgi:hypothetical protein
MNIVSTKPDFELNGVCQILLNQTFVSCIVKHIGVKGDRTRLYYGPFDINDPSNSNITNHSKYIDLKQCQHVQLIDNDTILIYINNVNGRPIKYASLKPDNIRKWFRYLNMWISYVRQVPIWQLVVGVDQVAQNEMFGVLQPMACCYVNNNAGFKHVLLRISDENTDVKLYYFETDTAKIPLGDIVIDTRTIIRTVGEGIKIHNEDIKTTLIFESRILAERWYSLIIETFENKRIHNNRPRVDTELDLPDVGRMSILYGNASQLVEQQILDELRSDLLHFQKLLGGMDKKSNKTLIDEFKATAMKNAAKKNQRLSKSVWVEDLEEEEELSELEQVLNLLQHLAKFKSS